ncbi:uncharacterized protein KGF55_004417 [Candida pseudojiufengensis]|uniref:uncharacterized protein n=1 Tax=Candida pseudojiufengensis TaxID=497109 RepID=UPI0022244CFC|nr:uncharacterized protein KGF55_004417 [Candida pseudojiufengensis]KAI5960847.1 hypothetical protein KGF55_004417 [Candida pseudojiufengensis]
MNKDDLGNKIAKTVIEKFNNLKITSGKPIIRSNGIKEWTVLASIVAITNDEITPITLATGVKVLPNKVRQYSNGLIVHDMHAEVLALRLFNLFLLGESQNPNSNWVKLEGEKFQFNKEIKLALFITEPPCGDASMTYLSNNLESNEPWELREGDLTFNRGRNNFNQLGIVRTKPGRSDSLISYSKSCSDKICLKQLIGICNSITSTIFQPIYLNYLVVKNINEEDFNRCFLKRLESDHPLKLITYDLDIYEFNKSNDKVPSPLSLLYICPSNTIQILNNGVKNGSYIKNKPPKPGGESIICNQGLIKKYPKRINSKSYDEFKRSNIERETLKLKGQSILQNWKHSDVDDFNL